MIKKIKLSVLDNLSYKNSNEENFSNFEIQKDIDNIEIVNKEKKIINIIGKTNRYEIKKITKDKNIKYKKTIIDINCFENQYQQLLDIENGVSTNSKLILKELDKKINGYKQQDILKKRFNEDEFINMEEIIKKLLDNKLKCYYCNNEVLILFNLVRESSQWTLDRIDNNLSHTNSNTVISCLLCNLNRKNLNSNSFLFTKNLKLTKLPDAI